MNLDNVKIPAKVLGTEELRAVLSEITQKYADCVGQTYGPGGKDTIIQTPNGVFVTKDGWTVAQNLRLGLDADLNSLSKMVLDVAANVNLKVGDGTTTAILVANYLNQGVINYIEEYPDKPMYVIKKELVDVVNLVCDKLMKNAKKLNVDGDTIDDNTIKIIRNIALVSTNWNDSYADMIAEIYKKTMNPYIRVENSGSDKSYVDYINGYDMKGAILIRDYYVNDYAKGAAVVHNPMILMFDYDITDNMIQTLSAVASVAASRGRKIVIMAPGFQVNFIKALQNYNDTLIRKGEDVLPLYPVQVWMKHPVERAMYSDMSITLNGKIINKEDRDLADMFNDLVNLLSKPKPAQEKNETGDEYNARMAEILNERKVMIAGAYQYLEQYAGNCGILTIDDKNVVAEGLQSDYQRMITERVERLKGELDRMVAQCDSLSMILRDVADYRTRISKLSCNSGIIKVGGYGDADLKSSRDALDDAISACRAAYEYGCIEGGNYAIPAAITDMLDVGTNDGPNYDLWPLLDIIKESFVKCIRLVCCNFYDKEPEDIHVKGDDSATLVNTINEGISSHVPYNVISGKYDKDLLEPVISSVEILKGSMRLVKLMATSSQYLYQHFTTDELIGAKDILDD